MQLAPVFYAPTPSSLPDARQGDGIAASEGKPLSQCCQCACQAPTQKTDSPSLNGVESPVEDVFELSSAEVENGWEDDGLDTFEPRSAGLADAEDTRDAAGLAATDEKMSIGSAGVGGGIEQLSQSPVFSDVMAVLKNNPELMDDLQGLMANRSNPIAMYRDAQRVMNKYPELRDTLLELMNRPEAKALLSQLV